MLKEEPEKKEGYFLAFRHSWEKVWEYKTLWPWAFLLAILGGSSFGKEEQQVVPVQWENLTEKNLMQTWQQALAWLKEDFFLILAVSVGVLAAGFLFLVIAAFIRGGLIRFLALRKEKKAWRKNGREVWSEGKKSFVRLLRFDLFFLFLLLVFLFFGLVLLGGLSLWLVVLKSVFWKELLGFVIFVLFLIFLASFLIFIFAKSVADFLVVLLEKKSAEALWESGVILKRKSKEFVKLLAMLFLAMWLGATLLEIGVFLCQAFFSGLGLVFSPIFHLAGSAYFLGENQSGQWFALGVLGLLISGFLNIFKIDYRLWWLEKNEIIQPLKEKKEKKTLIAEEALIEDLEVVDGAKALEAE